MTNRPSLRLERSLQRQGYPIVAGMDEVGRGALAGPVSVGVVVITPGTRSAPQGVKDSKLLSAAVRERMVPLVRRWAGAYAVGHASPAEIDEIGIIAALRAAGRRALAQLTVTPDLVILDGNHDWLTAPDAQGLLAFTGSGPDLPACPPVQTVIKGDMKCSTVAAASVLAKVERDGIVTGYHDRFPAYGWAHNKGYSAPDHLEALATLGPCELHRRSWKRCHPVDAVSHLPSEPDVSVSAAPAVRTDVASFEAEEWL